MRFNRLVLFVSKILVFTFLGCQDEYQKIISSSDIEVSVIRFDQVLFEADYVELDLLVEDWQLKYSPFYQRYTQHVLQIGSPDQIDHAKYMAYFLNNFDMNRAFKLVNKVYPNIDAVKYELTNAFKVYQKYFNDSKIPKIYTFMGGYNHSVVIDSGFIGIGLEKYLGADEPIYAKLGWNQYLVQHMHHLKIPSDVMDSWMRSEFPFSKISPELIEAILYHGKIHYVTKQLMPTHADTLIFGFTSQQLNYVQNNEANMWAFLLENDYLFSSNSMMVNRLTTAGPFTKEFTQASPGRATNWLGYRIINQFMENTDYNLPQLMNEQDSRKILKLAKYKP